MQGLAYSVSGGWNSSPIDHPGLFTAGGETAAPAEFLAAIQKVLEVGHKAGTVPHLAVKSLTSWRRHKIGLDRVMRG